MVCAEPAETVGGWLVEATASARLVLWLDEAAVPVTVSVAVPAGVLAEEVTVSVEDPEVVTEDGLNDAVTPAGRPLALMVTAPLNPPAGAIITA